MDMVLYILSYNYINPRFIYPLYTVYKSERVRKWSYEGVAQDSGISDSSSVTVENNKVAGGELSIDINGEGSAFLADNSVDIIFVQEKTYNKTSSSNSVTITASGHGDVISNVTVNLGDGAKASLLGDASVKVSNKTGETATKITATVTASDFVVGDGKNLSDLIKEYVFVWQIGGNYSYTEVNGISGSSDVTVSIPTGPSDVVVGCTMYVVISETVFSSGDVKTMVANINTNSDIDVKFEVTTTAS
ncbi:hypothetical protein [Methanomethylophilus alvi]|uniref:hypothetical protein n=1 Tax=Methanomethylophilus alvi TaxID=1291540 RepID=UPI0037DDB9A2